MADLRKCRDKKIMGVAGGIAEYTNMDKTVWRAIWVLAAVLVPPVILAYIILGIVMPDAPYQATQPEWNPAGPAPSADAAQPGETAYSFTSGPTGPTGQYDAPSQGEPIYTRQAYKQLTKSRDKWLAGVCGGVAEYFAIDPVLVRAIWLALILFAGTGILLYIVLAILMPGPRYEYRQP
jgi:phage shock protein PspC (stress-responsive transcriptional regulator)